MNKKSRASFRYNPARTASTKKVITTKQAKASKQLSRPTSDEILLPDYRQFIADLKDRVRSAQVNAARTVNRELILLYWDIGKELVQKQENAGWGESVVERVSSDLQAAFPAISGFSPRNLRDMKRLNLAYGDTAIWRQPVAKLKAAKMLENRDSNQSSPTSMSNDLQRSTRSSRGHARLDLEWRQVVAKLQSGQLSIEFARQLVAQVPWGQNLVILNKTTEILPRLWYLWATARLGWSRNVLLNQIKATAFERSVADKKLHNFALALPEHFAEQAQEMMKSTYNLEFLGIRESVLERDLENRLIESVQQFILELGYGFCFVGRQYRLTLGSKEYFVDLLFYHRFLKALVALDLKIRGFIPEDAGKMDFYLNLLNDRERSPDDQPSIGIILCAEKDDIEVEYALKSKSNPIGVAEYQLQSQLPTEFNGKLPTARQLTDAVRRSLPNRKESR